MGAGMQHRGTGGGRFLMALIDGGGTVPPALGLAAELVRRGHRVRVLADPTVERSARAAGCVFTPWRAAPHFDALADQTALIAAMETRSPWRQFAAARDLLICGPADRFAADVLATVREDPVDAVLAEAAIPGILIGAEAAGLPTAAMMANIYLRPTPGFSDVRYRLATGEGTARAGQGSSGRSSYPADVGEFLAWPQLDAVPTRAAGPR